jgi:P27 family predicted phage terminase small subunit
VPKRPRNLAGEARKLWDSVVPQLAEAGILAAVDAAALTACCEAWQLYRLAADAALANPTNAEGRRAVEVYHRMFLAAAAKCGLTPGDRQKMKVPPPAKSGPDFMSTFARDRGAGTRPYVFGKEG